MYVTIKKKYFLTKKKNKKRHINKKIKKIIMPFRSQDAWRRHPLLTSLYRAPFPGLKQGAMAFVAFVVAEQVWEKVKDDGIHGLDGGAAE